MLTSLTDATIWFTASKTISPVLQGSSFGCGRPHGCKPGSPESSTLTIVHAAFKARPNATHRIDTSHLFPSASAQEINK